MPQKITIQKASEEYVLSLLGDNKSILGIGVKVQVDGKSKCLSITNAKGRREFIFDGSSPAMVEHIGRLLVKAAEMGRINNVKK